MLLINTTIHQAVVNLLDIIRQRVFRQSMTRFETNLIQPAEDLVKLAGLTGMVIGSIQIPGFTDIEPIKICQKGGLYLFRALAIINVPDFLRLADYANYLDGIFNASYIDAEHFVSCLFFLFHGLELLLEHFDAHFRRLISEVSIISLDATLL